MPALNFTDDLEERHRPRAACPLPKRVVDRGRTLDETRGVVKHSDFVFAFVDEGGRLVAFARVITDRVFKALVFDVIVAPDRRGDGLGRMLVDHIVTHPVIAGVKHLELYCLPELVPFYEAMGFSTDVGGVRFMRRTPR